MSSESADESAVLQRIRRAIRDADAGALAERVYDLDTLLLMCGYFSAPLFEELLAIIREPEFLKMEGSWQLLRLFENSWDYLSEEQRGELPAAMEASYGQFADWMACFVISEILGRQYADERALQSFSRLRKLGALNQRSLVPHGLEHIVKGSQDKDVARRAFDELSKMRADSSEQVRGEVDASLARLANMGWK